MESIIGQSQIHFYEFMEVEILSEYIETGLQYMIKSIVNSSEKLISLRYYTQEIATLISGIKDAYFLIRHKGLYAQNFYSLERTNSRSKATIVLQILLWVILPYIFRKLQQKFNSLKQQKESGANLSMISRIYLKIFPIVFCLVKVVSLVMKFRYLVVPDSKYYNIQYKIAKSELGYIQQQKPSPFPIMTFLKSPGLFVLLVAHKIASYAFSSQRKSKPIKQIEDIRAPITQKKVKQCPICGKNYKNPAVLRTSGYVFCYSCIVQHIKGEGKCPVTQLQSDQSQIQIIYE